MNNARRKEIEALAGYDEEPISIASEMAASRLALFLDIDTRTINVLADKGVLGRKANGKFDTTASVQKYLAFAKRSRGNADLESAKVRVAEETAAKLEMQNALARREMIPAAEVEREWTGVLRDIRASLMAVSSRLGTRLPGLTAHDVSEIDAEIRAALEELAGDRDQ